MPWLSGLGQTAKSLEEQQPAPDIIPAGRSPSSDSVDAKDGQSTTEWVH